MSEATHGLLAGRHRALGLTAGEILIYLDDDVRLPEGWLDAILQPFADPAVHLVGCRYLPEYEEHPPSWLESLWTHDANGRYLGYLSLLDFGTQTREIDPVMVWGLCYAIRRTTLMKLGGFHPDGYPWELRRFRGDGETAPSVKARDLKLKAIYQGEIAVYHQVPKSRMTHQYFERRAYAQGISDSYSEIRRDRLPRSGELKLRLSARRIKAAIKCAINTLSGDPLTDRIRAAYDRGFAYHQAEVRNDPQLLDWVLRDNYFNYELPAGWERFVPGS